MKNYVQPGDMITVKATSRVRSGQVVVLGNLKGIAAGDAATGEDLTIATVGVYDCPKSKDEELVLGALAYVVDGSVVAAAPEGTEAVTIGTLVASAATGSTSCRVRLG